jgi:hypothetical protein
VRGHNTDEGLISLEELQQRLDAPLPETDLRAILIKLGHWKAQSDTELPRDGYGYYRGMSDQALYESTRAWWKINRNRAKSYPFVVSIFAGITRAVFEIDVPSWRKWTPELHGETASRAGFEAVRLRDGPIFEAFVGQIGKRIPKLRGDGRAVFGSGTPLTYWPD